ncbi:MAG: acylphosphatase [Myxococcota bacterium]
MKEMKLTIKGRVQGVFFRSSTRETAQTLGLKGWVRNLANGDVEITAQGQKESLQKLYEWAQIGPPAARVDKIEKKFKPPTEHFKNFKVKY